MQRARSFQFVLLFLSLQVALPSTVAQVVIATVPAGNSPFAVAVNLTQLVMDISAYFAP